jgi:teichuronic acid biosynthesis glycosyltransferase TuaC
METIMRVLFVASGNSKNLEIAPFIKSQGETLKNSGIDIQFFAVLGKGIVGYYKSAKKLHLFLKNNKFDIIHAHYTLCGWVAIMARPKIPVILSIMGDDAYGTYIDSNKVLFSTRYLTVLTYLIQPYLKVIISKSKNIDKYVYRRKIANIIPNGVKMEQFQDFENNFREELKLKSNKKYILFLANKKDKNKNFKLVQESVALLNDPNIEILCPFPISHDEVVKYLCSVDVFVMSTFMEGSSNAVKEAMACNCPMVVTDAGDAKWVIGNTEGCYLADFNVSDYSEKILQALDFAYRYKKTAGRLRILELGLDAETVAQSIIALYKKIIKTET